ncbi:unnamed protein product [Calypogeia fissa]
MASAVAVSSITKVVGLVPTSEARIGSTSSCSRVSLGGFAARNPEQLFAPQQQKNLRRRALTVTNAATKVKSPAETDWKIKREALLKAKARFMVRSVSAKEALQLQQEQGYIIIDVRPETDFKDGHPAGAINVQVYRLIKEWTLWDISRRVAFAFFGIFQGTEENPEFLNEVKDVHGLKKDDKIIVACVAGGTMKPTPNMAEGSQSRSLIAAYLLILDGFTNVVHVEGGLRQWFNQELPVDEIIAA